jgi:hypothetical protein
MHQVTIVGGSPSNWETTEPTITAAGRSGALSASRQRRDGSYRISFAGRPPGGSVDQHRHERPHRISDHHGHDRRADSPAHAF